MNQEWLFYDLMSAPRFIVQLFEGIGRILSELMGILAGVGMIIGSLSLTGTAHGLTGTLTKLGVGLFYHAPGCTCRLCRGQHRGRPGTERGRTLTRGFS